MEWPARLRAAFARTHDPSGFTLPEVLIASTMLLVGMLGTFQLVGVANGSIARTKARDGATNLARELLESAHETAYAEVGVSSWFTATLGDVSGGSGFVTSPTPNSIRTTVTRSKVTYTATVSWCALDDSGDGYGDHSTGTSWCSGSTTAGTADGQAEDFKRVSVAVSWAFKGGAQNSVTQTSTFAFTGSAIGPTVTSLSITQPSGMDSNAPVITSNPSGGIVAFLGSSVDSAATATDMKFTVNGVEQLSGVTNHGDGTWGLNWAISSLPDGTYTIAAVAVDSLGTHGQPRTIQVKLARATATPPQNVIGGYNFVYVSGTKTLVVELEWDASPEGSVTGYEVRNGSTVECASSLATSCIDLSPASSGVTTYSVRTNYLNGAGTALFVATAYVAVAPVSSLLQPGPPPFLTVTVNADGTRALRWTPPTLGNPVVDFYRIYRDGRDYTNRIDTAGATQTCPQSTDVCWTDTDTGGSSHTYRVTSASVNLVESDFAGPVSG